MKNAIIVFFAMLIIGSCDSHGLPTDPPLHPPIVNLVAPNSLMAGQPAVWTCSWIDGMAPFTVAWNFGGGAHDPDDISSSSSPLSVEVEMLGGEDLVTQYTATIVVTDGLGVRGSTTLNYEVTSLAVSDLTATLSLPTGNTLEVLATGGTAPYTVSVSEPGGLAAYATEVPTDDGTAVFSFYPVDPVLGGGGLCFIEVEDSLGFIFETDTFVGVEAMQLNDDTLYVIPVRNEVKVGEPVNILVATGKTANPFQFMLGVGVTFDADGVLHRDYHMDAEGMNFGSPGGYRGQADGVWVDITEDFGFIIGPDMLMMPGADPEGTLGTRLRFDFNVSPLGGNDVESVKGSLFNTFFRFEEPGLKHLGFQLFNGVARTYYTNKAAGQDSFTWSVLSADTMGNLHPSVVGQVDNTILVTE